MVYVNDAPVCRTIYVQAKHMLFFYYLNFGNYVVLGEYRSHLKVAFFIKLISLSMKPGLNMLVIILNSNGFSSGATKILPFY